MIFLVGMPRSGTTWVAKGIDSHPAVYYLHEPDSAQRMSVPNVVEGEGTQLQQQEVNTFFENVMKVKDPKVVGRLPFFEKDFYNPLQLNFNRASIYTNKALGRVINAAQKWSPVLFTPKKPHEIFVKSIESMGRVPLLAKASVDPKVVMLVRHPCAVINSEIRGEKKNLFSSKTPIYENWGLFENLMTSQTAQDNDLSVEKIKAMSVAQRLAWKWRIYYEAMLRNTQRANCKMVQYEDVCLDPAGQFRSIIEFTGLPWASSIDEYIDYSTGSHSDSYYAVAKDPKVAMNNWKTQLEQEDIDQILAITGHHLTAECWQA